MSKYDDVLQTLVNYTYRLYEEHDLSEADIAILADTFKWFAGEYHKLVVAGEVPKEKQLTQDYAKGLDAINEIIDGEL